MKIETTKLPGRKLPGQGDSFNGELAGDGPHQYACVGWASGRFCEHLLQNDLVQRQIGHQQDAEKVRQPPRRVCLVYLVCPVCLVYLVHLVSLVFLVSLVIRFWQPDRPLHETDQIDQINRSLLVASACGAPLLTAAAAGSPPRPSARSVCARYHRSLFTNSERASHLRHWGPRVDVPQGRGDLLLRKPTLLHRSPLWIKGLQGTGLFRFWLVSFFGGMSIVLL